LKSTFDEELNQQLEAIRAADLYRELRRVDSPQRSRLTVAGKSLLNFSSNDYLGLANEPLLKEAARKALEEFGSGAGASRLISGSLAPHHELEEHLATFKGTEAALAFSSGYATALGVLGALLDKEDIIILDKLVHASIIDGARLSGAKLRVFPHNDLEALEKLLTWAASLSAAPRRRRRVLVVTESVFSMDGDLAWLREIVELKAKFGAWLMLDEAHATGLYGERCRGLAEAYDLGNRIEIQMGTLGKALGSAGGYICGTRALIELVINRARSFIFSTAPPPATVAAASAAIQLLQSSEGQRRRKLLWARVDQVKTGLIGGPWALPVIRSAIIPLLLGSEARAVQKAAELRALGIFVPAVRFPAVARNQARLRLTVSAAHSTAEVEELVRGLRLETS
jgi:8-amino-7-oxononanoate synthase